MIYLYGKLRKIFGDSIDCEVNSVQELVRAAEANRPGFKDQIEKQRKYIIRRGPEFRKGKDVGEEEVEMRFGETTWHILPMPEGYSGAARVILGVVIFAVGAVLNYGSYGSLSALGIPMMKIGAVIALGGVASMLAPAPSIGNYSDRESPNERPSYLFDGPTNRAAAGAAVPLVYGFGVYTGSIFTSGGLDTYDAV